MKKIRKHSKKVHEPEDAAVDVVDEAPPADSAACAECPDEADEEVCPSFEELSALRTADLREFASRAIADQGRTIRIPVHAIERINRMVQLERRLVQSLGRSPTDGELAAEMGTSVQEVRATRKMAMRPASLQSQLGDDDGTLGDVIPDVRSPNPSEAVEGALMRERLASVLDSLTAREREVVDYRFGLSDGYGRTLEEVGRFFNVTRERVRQIESKALRKLRHPSRKNLLSEYFAKSA